MAFIEYVSLILAITIALGAVQFYLKRAVSSKYKESGDVFGHGRQFEPGVTTDGSGNLVE